MAKKNLLVTRQNLVDFPTQIITFMVNSEARNAQLNMTRRTLEHIQPCTQRNLVLPSTFTMRPSMQLTNSVLLLSYGEARVVAERSFKPLLHSAASRR